MNIIQFPFLVYISCATYNHVRYIEDALNGFCMQQTDFPFLAMVMDDASTDGEQEVINRYLEQNFDLSDFSIETEPNSDIRDHAWRCETEEGVYTFAQHKENKNCYILSVNLKKNLYKSGGKGALVKPWREMAKYIAKCEGDDYWTDPCKLQKQVDFLENNDDFSICYHPVKVWDEKASDFIPDSVVDDNAADSTIVDLAKGNYIHTLTVMYRRSALDNSPKQKFGIVGVGDYLSHMRYAEHGKIHRIDDCMGVYRQGVGVWTNNADPMRQSLDWLIAISKLYSVLTNEDAKKVLDKQIQIYRKSCLELYRESVAQEEIARSSKSYRLGRFLLHPFSIFKKK